jgi:hypothetical protein
MPNELIGLAIGLMFMEVLKFAYFFSAQLKHDILSTMLCWNLAIAVMIAMAMAWTPCRACPGGSRGSREPGAVSCDWPTRFTVTDIEARYGDYCYRGWNLAPRQELIEEVQRRLRVDATIWGPVASATPRDIAALWATRLQQQRDLLQRQVHASWNLFVALLRQPFPSTVALDRQDAWIVDSATQVWGNRHLDMCAHGYFWQHGDDHDQYTFESNPPPAQMPERLQGNLVGFCVHGRLDLADAYVRFLQAKGYAAALVDGKASLCSLYVAFDPVVVGDVGDVGGIA